MGVKRVCQSLDEDVKGSGAGRGSMGALSMSNSTLLSFTAKGDSDVGALLLKWLKKGFWACGASTWIRDGTETADQVKISCGRLGFGQGIGAIPPRAPQANGPGQGDWN